MENQWNDCEGILQLAFHSLCYGTYFDCSDRNLFRLYSDEPIYGGKIDISKIEPELYEAHKDIAAKFDKLLNAIEAKDTANVKAELLKLIKLLRCTNVNHITSNIKDCNNKYIIKYPAHFN